MIARRGDARPVIVFLHAGLEADALDILVAEAPGDVEIGAQGGVLLQPVLVVGFQEVDAAVFEDEEGHRAVDLVVILHVVHTVILGQRLAQLGAQAVIGLVPDAEDVDAVVVQLMAEVPVVFGKIRGHEDHVFHRVSFFLRGVSPSI